MADTIPEQTGNPDKLGPLEKPTLPPEKQAHLDEIMKSRFGFVEDTTRLIKMRWKGILAEVQPPLSSFQNTVADGRPGEPGQHELTLAVERIPSMKNKLAEITDNLDALGASHPSARATIEDILKRSVLEPDQQAAFELAKSAYAKYRAVTEELVDTGDNEREGMSNMANDSMQTRVRINRVASRVAVEMRKDLQDTFAGEVLFSAKRMETAFENARHQLGPQGRNLGNDAATNRALFKSQVVQLIEKRSPNTPPSKTGSENMV